jgi:hypothetical protein
MELLFSLLCGSFALRSVGRVHEMLKPDNYVHRPLFLSHHPSVSIFVTFGFWATLLSAPFFGWHYSGWPGAILRPLVIFIASLLLDYLVDHVLPRSLRYSRLLNPIIHLYLLPYLFLAGALFVFFKFGK